MTNKVEELSSREMADGAPQLREEALPFQDWSVTNADQNYENSVQSKLIFWI